MSRRRDPKSHENDVRTPARAANEGSAPDPAPARALELAAEQLGLPLLSWTPVSRYEALYPASSPGLYLPGAASIVTFGLPMLGGVVDTLLGDVPPFIRAWWRELSWQAVWPLLRNPAHLAKQLVKGRTSHYGNRYHLQEHLDLLNVEVGRAAYALARLLEERGHRALVVDPCKRHYFPLRGFLCLKHAALASGLGELGTHRQLITSGFGPRVWLGAVLTTAALPDRPAPAPRRWCKGCDACLRICPLASRAGGFVFDPHDCTTCSRCLAVCPAGRNAC